MTKIVLPLKIFHFSQKNLVRFRFGGALLAAERAKTRMPPNDAGEQQAGAKYCDVANAVFLLIAVYKNESRVKLRGRIFDQKSYSDIFLSKIASKTFT